MTAAPCWPRSARPTWTRCSATCRKAAVVPLSAFDLPDTKGEMEVERALAKLAARNVAAGAGPFFCGAGAYKHHVPSAVDHLIQRSEFLTTYTPYQPEIAQGTLQVSVRIPDPGGAADRHGGGQCLAL